MLQVTLRQKSCPSARLSLVAAGGSDERDDWMCESCTKDLPKPYHKARCGARTLATARGNWLESFKLVPEAALEQVEDVTMSFRLTLLCLRDWNHSDTAQVKTESESPALLLTTHVRLWQLNGASKSAVCIRVARHVEVLSLILLRFVPFHRHQAGINMALKKAQLPG